MKSDRPVLGGITGRRERLDCESITSIASVAGYVNLAHDAGALGIIAEVERLSDSDAFHQLEELVVAPPAIQAIARVRLAALRRRLFGEGWAA